MKFSNRKYSVGTITRLFLSSGLLLYSVSSSAITTNQLDDFTDGSLQSWGMGRPEVTTASMSNQTSGGPTGVNDNFLQVISDSTASAGSHKMTFFNKNQWTGDYLNAGITAISMDLNNFSSLETLNLRLAIFGGVNDPVDASIFYGGLFATSASVTLNSGSGWVHAVFSLLPGDLTAVSGNSGVTGNDAMASLGNVLELRVLNSPVPDWTGGAVTATLGIDNISIIVVPLPPAILLFGSGLIGLFAPLLRKSYKTML